MFPLQVLVNGVIAGSVYALVAAGFSLMYSTNRFANFAHGSVVMVGGYGVFTAMYWLHLPLVLSLLVGVLAGVVVGVVILMVVYEPLLRRRASRLILLVSGITVLFFLSNLSQIIYGAGARSFSRTFHNSSFEMFGVYITSFQIVIVTTAIIFLSLLTIWLRCTRSGLAVRAVADNYELALLSGIRARRVRYISFIVGSLLGAIGGILIGLEQNLVPHGGTQLIIKGFSASIIGGINSVAGSVLGSYVIGFAENIGIWFLPSGYKDAITFTLLLLFLLIRPQGLFGKKNLGSKQ
jgi:branched-chain amino acid transport system permease protein